MFDNLNEINRILRSVFERNKEKYRRWFSAARHGALQNPPSLKKYPVFEPFGNGARYPGYTFKLTSIWGKRGHGFHRGDDLRTVNVFYAGHELPMQAVEEGVVVTRTSSRLWGDYLILRHPNGLETLYAHNARILVQPGAKVEKGSVISLSGKTGNVSGPHMHFAVRANVGGTYYWFPPACVNWKLPVAVGIVHARGGLSLRTTSRRTAERLELIPAGGVVLVLKEGRKETIGGKRAAWVKVQYGYRQGWVFSAYLDITAFKSTPSARPKKTGPKSPKASAKTITTPEPIALLRKLKKEELLRTAMAMGISVATNTRKAHLQTIIIKEAHKALEALGDDANWEHPERAPLGRLFARSLVRELERRNVKTTGGLAGYKPFRTALVLAALKSSRR